MIKEIKKILIAEFQLVPIGICLYLIFKQFYFLSLTGLGLILILFTIYFFRDPKRTIPTEDNIVVSPADGKILKIEQVENIHFFGSTMNRIDIFLSIFNVHINRVPIAGTVEYINYRPGKFYPAMLPKASEFNERMSIGIRNDKMKILFNQIAGTIARRIVCYLREGDRVQRGETFGMIRFGSCVQVFIPTQVQLMVKQGDRVKAGESILGLINEA